MDGEERQRLASILRPVAPPRELHEVYTDDQVRRMLGVIKEHGPWPTITAHHFETVEQLVATSTGVVPDGLQLSLDDLATAHFRGFFAEGSVCLYPELHDCFYNAKLLELATSYWNAEYARPTMMLFNICGPHRSGLNAHLDATTFRGVRYENSPVWLMNVMSKSGLFTDYLVKMAQVITWWYRGERGTFTYWPDGPLEQPRHLAHPLWNKGLVVQNELMFHRGDPVGDPAERAIEGLKHRSLFAYDPAVDEWSITTDGTIVRRYRPEEIRLLVHWNAEVYRDRAELDRVMDHSDDLTHDRVYEMLYADLRGRGVALAEPSDPANDREFIRALIATYSIKPETDWLDASA